MVPNYYVYILECADGTYYTGVTNDLERRLHEHNTTNDHQAYTFSRRPFNLKHYAHYHDINQAIAWEKQLKGWSRRKKQALFEQDWEKVKFFSRNSKMLTINQSSTGSD